MRNIVLQQEEDKRKNFERLQKAENLKAEEKNRKMQGRKIKGGSSEYFLF